jgi:pSer/pThr/pTyr-binding forkhead associated (FHA) protein
LASKVTLKLAEELLDRFFREAEGQAARKIDLVFILEDLGTPFEKAEPALEYLNSRGLIMPYTGDAVYLTERGSRAVSEEQDIRAMEKYQPSWPQPAPQPQMASSSMPQPQAQASTTALPRPWRPTISYVDPNDGQTHKFEIGWTEVIGRSDEASLKIPDPRASKKHIEIKYAGDRYVLRDLGSANGTMVNGAYVDVHPLRHGDVVLVGRTEITYTCPEVIAEPPGEPENVAAAAPPPAVPIIAGAKTAQPERGAAKSQRNAPAGRAAPLPPMSPPEKPMMPAPRPPSAPEPSSSAGSPKPAPVAPSLRGPPASAAAPGSGSAVRIVKGQPEPRARAVEGDIFADDRAPPRAEDIFAPPSAKFDAPAEDIFAPPSAKREPLEDIFAPPSSKRDPSRDDMFAPPSAKREAKDLFGDFEEPSEPRGQEPLIEEPDLFDEDTPQREDRQRGEEFLSAPEPKEDLFGSNDAPEPEALIEPEAPPDLFAPQPKPKRPSVSPMPLGIQPRHGSDLLPIDEFDTIGGRKPSAEALSALDDIAQESTVALQKSEFPTAEIEDIPDPLEDQTRFDGHHLQSEAGLPADLPPWAQDQQDGTQPRFDEPGHEGGEEEDQVKTHHILAHSSELPEAPSQLEDPTGASGDVPRAVPLTYIQFTETLLHLRNKITDAGLPDPGRLLEAIDILRRHPSVRAALTEPRGE